MKIVFLFESVLPYTHRILECLLFEFTTYSKYTVANFAATTSFHLRATAKTIHQVARHVAPFPMDTSMQLLHLSPLNTSLILNSSLTSPPQNSVTPSVDTSSSNTISAGMIALFVIILCGVFACCGCYFCCTAGRSRRKANIEIFIDEFA